MRGRKMAANTVNAMIEGLEDRRMLSASSIFAEPDLSIIPQTSGSTVWGYSPAQIAKAYGFDQISFKNGTLAGNGAGQTIAIVDAYNDPNIASDLQAFDAHFGVSAPPSFTVENQTGGTNNLPTTDSGWAMEEALDVEWAHAMAPKAGIVLVEANSNSMYDLAAAVTTASSAAGVTVVSMSWGSGEFAGETDFNSLFTKPSWHKNETFIASSGDNGSGGGPSFPAVVPNVLAVGGTNMNLTSTGAYGSETGWSGSGGGLSLYEPRPSYQSGATSSTQRSSPDVAYYAGMGTGFAVYDTAGRPGLSGWIELGGTSAGAPQWAALIAIANQGRVANGELVLDGAAGTLPTLYSLMNDPKVYSASFHDVTSGQTSTSVSAKAGYDMVTGLGAPQANGVVQGLIGGASSVLKRSAGSSPTKPGAPAVTTHTASPVAAVSFALAESSVEMFKITISPFGANQIVFS
jgi:subtilase family serine protease